MKLKTCKQDIIWACQGCGIRRVADEINGEQPLFTLKKELLLIKNR